MVKNAPFFKKIKGSQVPFDHFSFFILFLDLKVDKNGPFSKKSKGSTLWYFFVFHIFFDLKMDKNGSFSKKKQR